MRKGGGEEERRGGARELFVMYVQRAHGDTAAVGNDFDTLHRAAALAKMRHTLALSPE